MTEISFPPELTGLFQAKKLLGKGGMGSVWAVQRKSDGASFALKVLLPELCEDKQFVSRFLRESEISKFLSHPFVVTPKQSGKAGKVLYILFDYIEGESLADLLQKGPLAPQEVLRLTQNFAEILQYTSEKGIVHRDIKPENVIIDNDGNAHLLDFGIARFLASGQTVTATGLILGTPLFMSPEACRGETLDCRADIFSLGVLLYYCLLGLPSSQKPPLDILTKRAKGQASFQLPRTFPLQLRKVVQKMTALEKEERISDFSELRCLLAAQVNEEEKPTKSPTLPLLCASIIVFLLFLLYDRQAGSPLHNREKHFQELKREILFAKDDVKIESYEKLLTLLTANDLPQGYTIPPKLPQKGKALHFLAYDLLSRVRKNRDRDSMNLEKRTCAALFEDLFIEYRKFFSLREKAELVNRIYWINRFSERQEAAIALFELTINDCEERLKPLMLLRLAETYVFHGQKRDKGTGEPPAQIYKAEEMLRPLVLSALRTELLTFNEHGVKDDSLLAVYMNVHQCLRTKKGLSQLQQMVETIFNGSMYRKELFITFMKSTCSETLEKRRNEISKPDKVQWAIKYLVIALKMAHACPTTEADIRLILARAYHQFGAFKKARDTIEECDLSVLSRKSIFSYYILKGNIFEDVNEIQKAIDTYKEALTITDKEDDKQYAREQLHLAIGLKHMIGNN